MKPAKQKIFFLLGAFCIVAGIIIAKISGEDHSLFTVIGMSMMALGVVFISINIIMRLIERSRSVSNK